MNPVQYIILNKGAGMSTGKAAAQAAHASQMGLLAQVDFDTLRSPYEDKLTNLWMRGGHYAKIVLEVPSAECLKDAERYINDRGFRTALIIDEGRTEISPVTPTALGTGVVDKDFPHARETFSAFKLYSDTPNARLREPTVLEKFQVKLGIIRVPKEKGSAR